MNSSSNLLVLGVTGQVGKHVAQHLKRSEANFSVGSRRKSNLEELADQFGASRFIDLDDPRTFDEALKNVTGVFLITGYTVDMLVQSKSRAGRIFCLGTQPLSRPRLFQYGFGDHEEDQNSWMGKRHARAWVSSSIYSTIRILVSLTTPFRWRLSDKFSTWSDLPPVPWALV